MPTLIKISYCCECSWAASAEDHPREELNALIVEHAVETGHDIESAFIHPDIDPPSMPLLN
jgi:predicted small metal-binding protein